MTYKLLSKITDRLSLFSLLGLHALIKIADVYACIQYIGWLKADWSDVGQYTSKQYWLTVSAFIKRGRTDANIIYVICFNFSFHGSVSQKRISTTGIAIKNWNRFLAITPLKIDDDQYAYIGRLKADSSHVGQYWPTKLIYHTRPNRSQ